MNRLSYPLFALPLVFGLAVNCFAQLTVSVSTTDASCYGLCDGAISASVSGGVAPYTYFWTGGVPPTASVQNICPGIYTVYVADSQGNTGVGAGVIDSPDPLTGWTWVSHPSCNAVCDGVVGVSGAGGTAPYTYYWSTGSQSAENYNVCAGAHSVTVLDANSCSFYTTLTLNEQDPLTITASGVDPTNVWFCNGSVWANTSGGNGNPYVYWPQIGTGSVFLNSICPGTYSVVAYDEAGCTAVDYVTLNYPIYFAMDQSGVPQQSQASQEQLEIGFDGTRATINYPGYNPNEPLQASIVSMDGKVVSTETVKQSATQIDLLDLKPGIYMVRVTGANKSWTKKLVVQ